MKIISYNIEHSTIKTEQVWLKKNKIPRDSLYISKVFYVHGMIFWEGYNFTISVSDEHATLLALRHNLISY